MFVSKLKKYYFFQFFYYFFTTYFLIFLLLITTCAKNFGHCIYFNKHSTAAMQGTHSAIVLDSLQNYKKVLKQGNNNSFLFSLIMEKLS